MNFDKILQTLSLCDGIVKDNLFQFLYHKWPLLVGYLHLKKKKNFFLAEPARDCPVDSILLFVDILLVPKHW